MRKGATVDVAFVLGSDELYREWGYTALSRHRDTARFYVSATPAFLNEPRPALETGDDVTQRVVDMLAASRAQHLALNGTKPDHGADRLADELRREEARLARIGQQLEAQREEHRDTRWYQRGRRVEVERRIDGALDEQRRSRAQVERLRSELERRQVARQPSCWRASDPLAAFEASARLTRERRLERSRDRDFGVER